MKKKFLAVALSCATMAMLVMPSAFADTNTSTSGEITTSGDGIIFTGTSFAVGSATTAQTLSGSKTVCYVDNSTAASASNFFTVTDTDATQGHTVTVKTSDTNFNTTAGGSTVPTTAMELSLEGGSGTDCLTSASQTLAGNVATKIAGSADTTALTLASGAMDDTSAVSFLDLDTTGDTLITSDATEQLQYKFRIGQLKVTWPQYTKTGTYSTTLVMVYNAS